MPFPLPQSWNLRKQVLLLLTTNKYKKCLSVVLVKTNNRDRHLGNGLLKFIVLFQDKTKTNYIWNEGTISKWCYLQTMCHVMTWSSSIISYLCFHSKWSYFIEHIFLDTNQRLAFARKVSQEIKDSYPLDHLVSFVKK